MLQTAIRAAPSERELGGCGSVTEVGAAAGPGDAVSSGQQGASFSLVAEGRGQAASSLQAHQSTDVEGWNEKY